MRKNPTEILQGGSRWPPGKERSLETKIGFCRQCGRAVRLDNPKGTKQSDWDKVATQVCNCKQEERKMHDERLTLASICGGAVQEKMDRAMEKVARNILDPNTNPDKRTITLKLTFKPNKDDREDVEVKADVTVSLAAETGTVTHFFVNKDLETETVTVMEHRKGEIRGQLDFSDIGYFPERRKTAEEEPEEEVDQETGEIISQGKEVLDFRKSM